MMKRTVHLLRAIALAAVLVLVAAACGDDGDATDAGSSGDATGTDTGSSDGGDADGSGDPDPADSSDGDGGPSLDAGTASVTLGTGEQFDFDQELICIGMGGAMSGTFLNSEGVEVSIDVPPEDWETSATGDWDPPSLTLRDERDPQDWRIFEAGPDLAATYADAGGDRAVITDWSTDGGRVTGNGFALDTYGVLQAGTEGTELPQPVPVFFAFECS